MEWKDDAVILATRRHGETSLIVELMTKNHGRHLGLVRGGRSRKKQPFLQPGNSVEASWRARLDQHLGAYVLEPTELRAARLIETPIGVFGIQTIAGHLRLLPERDVHRHLYDALIVVLSHLEDAEVAAALVVRFELTLLDDLGFGLDLSKCAVTGDKGGLTHVSPKTGRAVSRAAAEPWLDRLLPLPSFLLPGERDASVSSRDIKEGVALTEYFLVRHVYQPRGMSPPGERASFFNATLKNIVEI